MSVAETLLRMLIRFPKLLIANVKQCSSTALHLLRYLFSLWNASVQKGKRRYSLEENTDNIPPSKLHEEIDGGASTLVENATALCSEDAGSILRLTPRETETPAAMLPAEGRIPNPSCMQSTMPRSASLPESNVQNYPPGRTLSLPRLWARTPLEEGLLTIKSLFGLLDWLAFLDHPGTIRRSLVHAYSHRRPNIQNWLAFSQKFQGDVDNVTLFATVLLSGNLSFLSLITQNGLSYWPQRLSYVSLFAALGSIWMGLAVRTPRFIPNLSSFSFQLVLAILGLPFELFLYSIYFFIVALIIHLSINTAMVQIYAAAFMISSVILWLILYWLITVPSEVLHVEGRAPGGQAQ